VVPHRSVTRSLSKFQIRVGGDVQAAFGTGGLTNSAVRRDNTTPPANLWRQAITCGPSGVKLWSSTTTR